MRARRALILLPVLLVALAGGARALALARAEAALRAHGLSWARRVDGWDGARWEALTGPGVAADSASLRWFPRPAARVDRAAVDLSARGSGGGAGDASRLPSWVAVEVTDLTVSWGGAPLAGPLSGPLWPAIDLRGPGAAVTREDGAWVARLHRALDLPQLRGEADLTARLGQTRALTLDIPDAVLASPTLADDPLPAHALHVEARWGADGAVDATARFGEVTAHGIGTLTLEPRTFDLHITVGPAPLEEVVALFGDQIPEARAATLSGKIGLGVTLSGPPLAWRVEPRADGLAAAGVIRDPAALVEGPLTYRVTGSDGGTRVRETGEGNPDWVEAPEAKRVADAVIASEDADFWTHPGYDLPAIQEALDAWAAGEARPRGGSTLPQQLAKNLFLNGDRTLVRKLRELLYALDLERTLGKRRILALYVNAVQFGPDLWGVGPASDAYFLKRPEGLTWREAAFLASVLPAPDAFYRSALLRDRPSVARVDGVIDNLRRLGSISTEEAEAARKAPLRFVPPE